MRALENSEQRVMVILADNTALCFSKTETRASSAKKPETAPPSPHARVAAFLKSLLPRVSRVSPVEAVLQSGERLKLITPPAVS